MSDEAKPNEATSISVESVKALIEKNAELRNEITALRAQLNPQHGAGVVGAVRTGGEEYPKWLHDLGITVHSREHEDSVRKPKEEPKSEPAKVEVAKVA